MSSKRSRLSMKVFISEPHTNNKLARKGPREASMLKTTGTLIIRPNVAELKTDKNIVFKADPYCVFTFGNQKKTTSPCKRGGKYPIWNETFIFERTEEDVLKVQLWDKEYLLSDDFLAEGEVSMVTMLKSGTQSIWVDLFRKGVLLGRLLLETEYTASMVDVAQSNGVANASSRLAQVAE